MQVCHVEKKKWSDIYFIVCAKGTMRGTQVHSRAAITATVHSPDIIVGHLRGMPLRTACRPSSSGIECTMGSAGLSQDRHLLHEDVGGAWTMRRTWISRAISMKDSPGSQSHGSKVESRVVRALCRRCVAVDQQLTGHCRPNLCLS